MVGARRRTSTGDLGQSGYRLMPLLFVIPGALREFSAGRSDVRVDGRAATAAEALSLLWTACPGARDRVLTERGDVRTHINIFIDGENIRYNGGLSAPVRDGSEIIILPAVSGGSCEGDSE